MKSIRLIPCLDIDRGRVVKGVQFQSLRDAGDPIELAAHYGREGADELVFLDISASHEGRATVVDLAARVAEQIFIPFTVGGGLGTIDSIRAVLVAGADKVSVNSAALADPGLVRSAADRFGSQCIVVAIDARRALDGHTWEVFSHGGRTGTGRDAIEWAVEVARLGAGEILLTSMDGDGSLSGYDLGLTRSVADAVPIPVIASGGAGNPRHLVDAATAGGADAVLLASIVHSGEYRIADLKAEMASTGLPMRLAPRAL